MDTEKTFKVLFQTSSDSSGANEAKKAIADLSKTAKASGSDVAGMQAKADAGLGGAAKAAKGLKDESGKAAHGIEQMAHGLRGMGPLAATMHESIRFLSSPLGILILGMTEFARVVGEGKQKADEYKKAMETGGQELEDFEHKLTDADRAQMRMGEQFSGSFKGIKEAISEVIAMPWEPYIDRSVAAMARLKSGEDEMAAASDALAKAEKSSAEEAADAYAAAAGKTQEALKTYLDSCQKAERALAQLREAQIRSKIASGEVSPEEGAKQISGVKAGLSAEVFTISERKWAADRDQAREQINRRGDRAKEIMVAYKVLQEDIAREEKEYERTEVMIQAARAKRQADAAKGALWGDLLFQDADINAAVSDQRERSHSIALKKTALSEMNPKATTAQRTIEDMESAESADVLRRYKEWQALHTTRQAETINETTASTRGDLEAKERALEEQIKADEQHLTQAKEGKAPEQIDAVHAAASAQTSGSAKLTEALQKLAQTMDKHGDQQTSLVHTLTQKLEAEIRAREVLKAQIQQLPTGGN